MAQWKISEAKKDCWFKFHSNFYWFYGLKENYLISGPGFLFLEKKKMWIIAEKDWWAS